MLRFSLGGIQESTKATIWIKICDIKRIYELFHVDLLLENVLLKLLCQL